MGKNIFKEPGPDSKRHRSKNGQVVFFDFDKTLTTRDTILELGIALARAKRNQAKHIFILLLLLVALKLRIIDNHKFKQRFAELLLKNQCSDRINKIADSFIDMKVHKYIQTNIVDIMLNHIDKGDRTYIVSSNYDFFLNRLMNKWRLAGIIATDTEIVDSVYSGKLLSESCEREQKVIRAISVVGEEQTRAAIAYGDSRGDLELVNYVREGYWVKGNKLVRHNKV